MTLEIKKFLVTDHQDNEYDVIATQVGFDESWLNFYDGTVIVAAFFQPAGFMLTEEE